MRHEISFDPAFPYVFIRTTGTITPSEFSGIFEDLTARPEWDPSLNILSDYRDADGRKLSAEEVQAMARGYAALSQKLGRGRSAIVVSESLQYGLARMWISWTEMKVEREVRVFTSLEEARAWLLEDPDEGEAGNT